MAASVIAGLLSPSKRLRSALAERKVHIEPHLLLNDTKSTGTLYPITVSHLRDEIRKSE